MPLVYMACLLRPLTRQTASLTPATIALWQYREAAALESAPPFGTVANLGEPLRFTQVESLVGFAAEAPQKGQATVKVYTRLAITSDQPVFHRLVQSLGDVIFQMAQRAGAGVRINRADTVLLVIRADNTAELWLDTAAVTVKCLLKRGMVAGGVVFEQDVADVIGMGFPCVNFEPTDKVICLFRQDWRFGLAFDFNPHGNLDIEAFESDLGTLYRELRYTHLYQAISDQELLDELIESGWFPFAEIITAEFKDILRHCENGFDLVEVEGKVIAGFGEERLQRIFERWVAKPHFARKEALLKEAFDAFIQKKPVAVIKILLTEIEGILNDAYRAAHEGRCAKLRDLLEFVQASAEQRTGGANTLLFPAAFGSYLTAHTFANFNPLLQTGTAASRHAVGHGAAAQETYTMARALQAILTLDQLAFYT